MMSAVAQGDGNLRIQISGLSKDNCKAPEGEFLTVVWGVDHSCMFTFGRIDLMNSVNHKYFLAISNIDI